MRKIMLLLTLMLIALSVVPALATPTGELTAMAAYAPPDAPVFVAFRTDDAFIDTLDSLLYGVVESVTGQVPEGMGLRAELDTSASYMVEDGDFASVYRTWMGDTAAFFIPSVQGMLASDQGAPYVLAIAVTDAAAAETFLDTITEWSSDYTKTETDAGIGYESDYRYDAVYLLKDDVMIAGGNLTLRQLSTEFESSLADNPEFTEAMNLLSAGDYNIAGYINVPAMIKPFLSFAPMMLRDTPFEDVKLGPVVDAIGPTSFGFTILDGRSLTIDVVQGIKDAGVLADFGADMRYREPLNLDFAAFVPADSAFVIHDQKLGTGILDGLDMIEQIGLMLDAEGINLGTLLPERERFARTLLDSFNINDLATFARLTFKGMTGLELEDALGWMSSDYASYMRFETGGEALPVIPDNGLVVAVTDRDAAQANFDSILLVLDQANMPYALEDGQIVLPQLRTTVANYLGTDDANLDMVVALNDDVAVMGMRPGVQMALNSENGGLAAEATFMAAAGTFLPDPVTLLYVSGPALQSAAETMAGAEMFGERTARSFGEILPVLSLLESASATAAMDDNNNGHFRLVLTLAD